MFAEGKWNCLKVKRERWQIKMLSRLFFFLVVPSLPSDRRNVIKNFILINVSSRMAGAAWGTIMSRWFVDKLELKRNIVQTRCTNALLLDFLTQYILWCFHFEGILKALITFSDYLRRLTSPADNRRAEDTRKARERKSGSKTLQKCILKSIIGIGVVVSWVTEFNLQNTFLRFQWLMQIGENSNEPHEFESQIDQIWRKFETKDWSRYVDQRFKITRSAWIIDSFKL